MPVCTWQSQEKHIDIVLHFPVIKFDKHKRKRKTCDKNSRGFIKILQNLCGKDLHTSRLCTLFYFIYPFFRYIFSKIKTYSVYSLYHQSFLITYVEFDSDQTSIKDSTYHSTSSSFCILFQENSLLKTSYKCTHNKSAMYANIKVFFFILHGTLVQINTVFILLSG